MLNDLLNLSYWKNGRALARNCTQTFCHRFFLLDMLPHHTNLSLTQHILGIYMIISIWINNEMSL